MLYKKKRSNLQSAHNQIQCNFIAPNSNSNLNLSLLKASMQIVNILHELGPNWHLKNNNDVIIIKKGKLSY